MAVDKTREPGARRSVPFLLGVLCLLLVGYAGMHASTLLVQARTRALFDAERAIAQATAPLIEQDRIRDRLVVAVQSLVGQRRLGLNYVTLRNRNGVTLVSRGRLSEAFTWLPTGQARQLRSWYYRMRSAETNRPVMRDEKGIGYAHFGVSWLSVMSGADSRFPLWAGLTLAGILGLCAAIVRMARAPRTPSAETARRPKTRKIGSRKRTPETGIADLARAPLSRLARRARRPNDEFAPIAAAPRAADDALESKTDTAANDDSAVTPMRPTMTDVEPEQPEPEPTPSPTVVAERQQPKPATPASADREAPTPEHAQPSARPDAAPPLHAPRVSAAPELGDSTLDLRFYPIWADAERRVLSAAFAALAWRTGDTGLVDSATLTRLAEKDGALRAFTQWIARRFSLLHGNWRALELATVPILLPIPSDMLAFADAEAVWRDALRRTDRDPDDLILRLGRRAAGQRHTTLPVRRALTLERPGGELPSHCDVLCLHPDAINGNAAAWRERLDDIERPVLLGPVADVSAHAELIAHDRVCWYTDSSDSLHSPRAFARLLTRHGVAPL